jgi:hypothetical protein
MTHAELAEACQVEMRKLARPDDGVLVYLEGDSMIFRLTRLIDGEDHGHEQPVFLKDIAFEAGSPGFWAKTCYRWLDNVLRASEAKMRGDYQTLAAMGFHRVETSGAGA